MRSTLRRFTGGRWPRIREGEHLTCTEVGRLMQRFLDGEVDDGIQVRALAAHLDVCPPCGHEADVYRAIKDALGRGRPPVDAEVVDRLRDFGRRLAEG